MSSQLNVDTIVDKAGSGGTNVKVGNTSTYVADGGSATQNLVQGLLKMWADLSGGGTPAIDDSLNTSSVTDVGTGERRINLTNSMSNTNYMVIAGIIHDGNSGGARGAPSHQSGDKLTGSVQYKIFYGSTTSSDGDETDGASVDGCAIAGDLA